MTEHSSQEKKPGDDEHTIRYVNLYESNDKIYTRKISGFYQRIRRYTGIPLLAGFLLLPWLVIDGRPAVLFDLPARQFNILWITFWPQDFMLLAWALIISAFSLFTVTALIGRVWCGFTCPQTVWTMIFIYIENLCEGDRNKRIKLDAQAWNVEKIARKSSKHSLWLLVAFITGATFIGYFVPIRELLLGLIPYRDAATGIVRIQDSAVVTFWTLFFTGMTYLNAGWMREQVCRYMCPYARLQAVMYDRDTLAVHYDKKRGEQRGPRKPGDEYKQKGLGDCIDCSWCVQVCPVDIDIRDGLQYDCINCGLCVDACNQVMDKMNYPRGLVRFASEDELETGKTHFWRPRVFAYGLFLAAMVSAFVYTLIVREPIGVDVLRDRSARMYRISDGEIQNSYTLKINNMDRKSHSYSVRVEGDYPFKVKNYRPVELEEGEIFTLPIRVAVPQSVLKGEKHRLIIYVQSTDDESIVQREETIFIGPSKNL